MVQKSQYLNSQVTVVENGQLPLNIVLSTKTWDKPLYNSRIKLELTKILIMVADVGKWVSSHFLLLFQIGELKQMCRFAHTCMPTHTYTLGLREQYISVLPFSIGLKARRAICNVIAVYVLLHKETGRISIQ
jgi:hypothetical protein